MSKPYVVSKDSRSGAYYCHMAGYAHIPVFGSIGDKKKAMKVCRIMNQSNTHRMLEKRWNCVGKEREMTREEAINLLADMDSDKYTAKEAVALTMAIKALEHPEQNVVSVVPCGDAISRQAVLEVIRKSHCEEWVKAEIGAPIETLQSVNPQSKTGHWITTRTFMHDGEYYCDKCKCDAPNNEKWDFCPNCGCRMV